MRERKKELVGRVISDKMDKTVVVSVGSLARHRPYLRTMRRTKKYMAHDEQNDCRVGDLVRIQESRPISRHKSWRVLTVLDAAATRGKAVALPVGALTAGVTDVATIADVDVTPGILPGTAIETQADQPGQSENGNEAGHR
ncbi:MAG: 30S ribosomal protein S17 [Chloroflexota bacterium]